MLAVGVLASGEVDGFLLSVLDGLDTNLSSWLIQIGETGSQDVLCEVLTPVHGCLVDDLHEVKGVGQVGAVFPIFDALV